MNTWSRVILIALDHFGSLGLIALAELLIDQSSVYLFLNAFVLLFFILDAIGNVPIFLTLTSTLKEQRKRIATTSIIISLIILITFAYVGELIFRFLGITINDFRIAGGIILFVVAVQYLIGKTFGGASLDPDELAAFPIATPLLAGPGAISAVIILSAPPYNHLISTIVILGNSLIAWVVLVKGDVVFRILGSNGSKVFTRIMGLLIAAIAISFVREGIEAIVMALIKQ
jgi:multiple antibiotic resistance protein